VLSHPLTRAQRSFCRHILTPGDGAYAEIRQTLRGYYRLPVPKSGVTKAYDTVAHRRAFMAFLSFLKGNLAGQTSLRVDLAWASQTALVKGMANVAPPDHLLREATLAPTLAHLEVLAGLAARPLTGPDDADLPFALADIYDAEMEKASREIYMRDYMMFGFADWPTQVPGFTPPETASLP